MAGFCPAEAATQAAGIMASILPNPLPSASPSRSQDGRAPDPDCTAGLGKGKRALIKCGAETGHRVQCVDFGLATS